VASGYSATIFHEGSGVVRFQMDQFSFLCDRLVLLFLHPCCRTNFLHFRASSGLETQQNGPSSAKIRCFKDWRTYEFAGQDQSSFLTVSGQY